MTWDPDDSSHSKESGCEPVVEAEARGGRESSSQLGVFHPGVFRKGGGPRLGPAEEASYMPSTPPPADVRLTW